MILGNESVLGYEKRRPPEDWQKGQPLISNYYTSN